MKSTLMRDVITYSFSSGADFVESRRGPTDGDADEAFLGTKPRRFKFLPFSFLHSLKSIKNKNRRLSFCQQRQHHPAARLTNHYSSLWSPHDRRICIRKVIDMVIYILKKSLVPLKETRPRPLKLMMMMMMTRLVLNESKKLKRPISEMQIPL